MRRLRWTMDGGGFWEMDLETPVTMEGRRRWQPGPPLPLGLSRGSRLSRAKQLDFMHRFMASPLVASFSGPRNGGPGLVVHHADIFHLRENWSATIMEQFHLQKFVTRVKQQASEKVDSPGGSSRALSWIRNLGTSALDVYHLGFGTEISVTPESSVLVEAYGDSKDGKGHRNKAVFTQKFPRHDLVLEAASPRLFVSGEGTYWDVPLSMAVDFSSTSSGSRPSYHLCLQHNSGQPRSFSDGKSGEVPPALLPGFCAKAAVSMKKNADIWRKKGGKTKMLQPYDMFLCDPHISASVSIGSVVCALMGDNSVRISREDESRHFKPFSLNFPKRRSSLLADSFASISCTAQLGHFQKLFFDMTRFHARLDCLSVSTFLNGSSHLIKDWYKSQKYDPNAVHAICPDVTLSFQQQIVGPISFRAESRFGIDLNSQGRFAHTGEHIFALEYAMQVLGSARATAWYSPKRQEAMVELRFFES
ncbi:unnamed protein product [Spirodela intermedia]|uniref:Uncharacterized protein n=1 Tax=Spirodela intermedia TaxID=51605 RepID=A0A7I8JFE9_SPIIN|nr:unnamed protein product [Spirodela intermedia]CAA6668880.1 unnamed protein product [Spirodela intermedia]